jgi:hypothetical protein
MELQIALIFDRLITDIAGKWTHRTMDVLMVNQIALIFE